jgi:D-glycero-D-manno-heptose 1,7-bisphosphate phosphatase
MKKALFLDRDGVINIDHGYVGKIEDFEFVDGILDFIKSAQKKGYLPIVVTNQSGIGRGYYSLDDFKKLTNWMLEQMQQVGIEIDRSHVFYCPHSPEAGCNCRKPMPGMLLEAKERFNIDMKNSWMIGDKQSDIEAAKNAGVGNTYLTEKNRKLELEIIT